MTFNDFYEVWDGRCLSGLAEDAYGWTLLHPTLAVHAHLASCAIPAAVRPLGPLAGGPFPPRGLGRLQE